MEEGRNSGLGAPVRTRFAPSPTGAMHLGHARTHLVAWLAARSTSGSVVMRIEDLDTPRVREGSEASLLEDHRFLGLDWDEGPVRQSERFVHYERALERLRASGHVYPCTCSRKEIEAVASAPHGDEGPIYPGTCRNGPTHPERVASLRFRMDESVPTFVDRVMGPSDPSMGKGDFVVRRADGLFSYQLAVVVDDDAMGITDVVRGADILASTPRQLALFAALGRPAPRYAHLPLVRAADGERLAKRSGARGIAEYLACGISAETILGALAWSIGLADAPAPIAARELVGGFAFERIANAPLDRDPVRVLDDA